MTTLPVELALGTVQFGMDYGVVGRGEVVPIKEVRQILARAFELGIRVIDTAPVYGSIEANLPSLMDGYAFDVVSKVPALTPEMDLVAAEQFVSNAIRQTHERLGDSLKKLLFHSSNDLLGARGSVIWSAAEEAVAGTNIALGVSCYSPSELLKVREKYFFNIAQLPGNALDQRLRTYFDRLDGIEIHLRSIFLQGILLHKSEELAARLPMQTLDVLTAWNHWCLEQGFSLMQGALCVSKHLPGVRYCVVGVDSLAQLEEIYEHWVNVESLDLYPSPVEKLEIIDPRYWSN